MKAYSGQTSPEWVLLAAGQHKLLFNSSGLLFFYLFPQLNIAYNIAQNVSDQKRRFRWQTDFPAQFRQLSRVKMLWRWLLLLFLLLFLLRDELEKGFLKLLICQSFISDVTPEDDELLWYFFKDVGPKFDFEVYRHNLGDGAPVVNEIIVLKREGMQLQGFQRELSAEVYFLFHLAIGDFSISRQGLKQFFC